MATADIWAQWHPGSPLTVTAKAPATALRLAGPLAAQALDEGLFITLDGVGNCSDVVGSVLTSAYVTLDLEPGCYRFSSELCYEPAPGFQWTAFAWGEVMGEVLGQGHGPQPPGRGCVTGSTSDDAYFSRAAKVYFVIYDTPCADNSGSLIVRIEASGNCSGAPPQDCLLDSSGYRPVCDSGYQLVCLQAWSQCGLAAGADLAACYQQFCACQQAGLDQYCPRVDTPTPLPTETPIVPTQTPFPTPSATVTPCAPVTLNECLRCRDQFDIDSSEGLMLVNDCLAAVGPTCLVSCALLRSVPPRICLPACTRIGGATCGTIGAVSQALAFRDLRRCIQRSGCDC